MRKPPNSPIKASVIMALESQSHKSAPKLMKHAYGPTNKSIEVSRAEGEPIYHEQLWYPSVTHAVITQVDLGGSHSRTKEISARACKRAHLHLPPVSPKNLTCHFHRWKLPCKKGPYGIVYPPKICWRASMPKMRNFYFKKKMNKIDTIYPQKVFKSG